VLSAAANKIDISLADLITLIKAQEMGKWSKNMLAKSRNLNM
jgi:hypothetical protein